MLFERFIIMYRLGHRITHDISIYNGLSVYTYIYRCRNNTGRPCDIAVLCITHVSRGDPRARIVSIYVCIYVYKCV